MLHFEEVMVGSGGSVACARCGSSAAQPEFRDAEDISADIRAVVAAWSVGAGPNIALTGADAYSHPGLPAIISGAIADGVSRVRADTDGVALQSPANAAGSLAAGVRHIRFTLLGGTAGVHDVLTDRPGHLDAAVSGVRTYLGAADQAGCSVSVTCLVPVCRHDVRDVCAAVATAVESGATKVLLRITDGGLDLKSATRWLTAACDTGVVNGAWVEIEGVPYCALPGYELHLAHLVRDVPGAKPPSCAECALDGVCGGGPPDSSPEMLAGFAQPAGAAALADRVRVVRGGGAS